MEILIAMSILIVGLMGILVLFPSGLNATKKAIEDTNAALVAESAYASLRAAARKTTPGGKLTFFHDGMSDALITPDNTRRNQFPLPKAINFDTAAAHFPQGKAIGIPNHHYYDSGTNSLKRGTPAIPASGYKEGEPVDIDKYRVLDYLADSSTGTLKPLDGDFCRLAQGSVADSPFNVTLSTKEEPGQLSQYSFNIQ